MIRSSVFSSSILRLISNQSTSCLQSLSRSLSTTTQDDHISVTFVDKEGKDHTVEAATGKNLLEVAHEHEIDLEGDIYAFTAANVSF